MRGQMGLRADTPTPRGCSWASRVTPSLPARLPMTTLPACVPAPLPAVYEDFLTYTSGVYQCTSSSGQYLGGHAVAVIGYGTENGQDYWLVRNSWNNGWGDNGLFKIARGIDTCGVEEDMVAGAV